MKKLLLVLLIFPLLICTGFKKEKPYIILSQEEVTKNTTSRIERNFPVKTRIYYALVMPEGLKYSGVRMQIKMIKHQTGVIP